MTPAHAAFAILTAVMLAADQKVNRVPSPKDGSFPKYTAVVPGYRRAKQSEITPAMYQEAIRAVQPGAAQLGDVRYFDGYVIAMETHFNESKGHHKGASIFVPV